MSGFCITLVQLRPPLPTDTLTETNDRQAILLDVPGIGGAISVVTGSIILVDTGVPGFMIVRPLIGAIALFSLLGLVVIIGIAVKVRQGVVLPYKGV